jgi:hypothetical protein
MRALVTGGAGFIGSHLVDALVAMGHDVRVLDDLSAGERANVNPEAKLIEADVADARVATESMDGIEVVFHEAAIGSVRRSIERPLVTDHANVHGTLVILDAALRAGVRRIVCASSSSVYGGADARPTPEETPLHPRSPYAVSKLAAEWYATVFHELHGLETVGLRYFNVYGPRQRHDSPTLQSYPAGSPLFDAAIPPLSMVTACRHAISRSSAMPSPPTCMLRLRQRPHARAGFSTSARRASIPSLMFLRFSKKNSGQISSPTSSLRVRATSAIRGPRWRLLRRHLVSYRR